MKKILSLLLVFMLVFTLAGCKKDDRPTIEFHLNGGSGETTLKAEVGEEITISNPTKEGYMFDGWFLDEALTSPFNPTKMPSGGLTLYAKWTMGTPTITMVLNGGIGEESVTGSPGSAITVTDPTKDGFVFGGWYLESTFETEYTFSTIPNEDVTVFAKWDTVSYTFSVVANIEDSMPVHSAGDIVDGLQTYNVSAPVVEGYEFSHWRVLNTTAALSQESVYLYSVSEDTVLEAVYFPKVVEPELFYETGFEDGNKGSYATANVDLSGETWEFNDALIGNLATDLSVSGNSVRIRNGFIQSQFSASDLAQVIFSAGTYGNDSDGLVTFSISPDGVTWTEVDSFMSTGELVEKSYVFDSAMFTSLGLDSNDSYYFKISSSESGRTNIDDFSIYTGEGTVVDDTPLYVITFTEDMEYSYLIDEVVDLEECVATHPTLGATTCDISGTVDNTTAGSYLITYSKTDEFGNTVVEVITITIISESNTDLLLIDLMAYYDDAEGLHGTSLMDALHDIINNGFSGVTYGEARYILDDTDEDPNNPNNLILVYLGTSINGNWDSGSTWNREHLWPQSLLGVSANNGTVNSASDLYNLMPSNPGENSTRGNSPYSEMGLGYEPRDEVKGDIARALFYMMIMYDELDLVNHSPGVHEMAYLDELIEWHLEDPVDDFEMNRLEVIYGAQHNRNPFVDYPHFVELIWFYNTTAN